MSEPIDQWFPKRGQCRICGVPGADQRHRRIEAIADAVKAGDGKKTWHGTMRFRLKR